jgi:hypothetical protein
MAGTDSGADPEAGQGWRWDVALSFAGAQRGYVQQVAEALRARGVRCFYDADEEIDLWGRYLAEELPVIYGEQAAAVVVFISADYATRDWTRHERRAALSRAVRERREYVLPARFDDTPLPGLLPDMSYVDLRARDPQDFAAMIAAKLASLSIIAPVGPVNAGGLGPGAELERPPGAVRVSEADPRRLGVHAAISVPGAADETPPEYVFRDVDGAEFGLRARVAAAVERGGFVLLVGGSSVGKTRCAVEAVKALLPDWWLVHPAGPAELAALAQTPASKTLVWLDELQRYLEGEDGLTGAVVRRLLHDPYPAVIVGTLWPELYSAYTALPVPGGADPHAREREVLNYAAVVRIGSEFSPAEHDRARAAAACDPRLLVALEAARYGLPQTLAAAPLLVARWEDAKTANPYAWAVLTAALDVVRLGARAPLGSELLRAAAPDYCTSQQQAEAAENWFEQALAYATGKLHGAVAALSPAGAGMGRIAGYTVAEYLIQHASRERRHAHVPASAWNAVLSHLDDPADNARLADSARRRFLYGYAIPLYRRAADAGSKTAASRLARLLAARGDVGGLTARADVGERSAARRLAELLAERGDADGLRARADTGDRYAARRLAELLAERGDVDLAVQILSGQADTGDANEARLLARLLAGHRDLDGLRARADADDRYAAGWLAELLAERGDVDGLRARADAGDRYAAERLADLLAQRGDVDGLRARADAGDRYAAERLAELLAERGDVDVAAQILSARADAGDVDAARLLARLLTERGDLDGLRARADDGDKTAARLLARLLAERGDVDGLRARADAGDRYAAERLVSLLTEHGDLDGLRARADAGDKVAASRLAYQLAEHGDVDAAVLMLRARADSGNRAAALRLAGLLAETGDDEGAAIILRTRADRGDRYAAELLADFLAERGDVDGLLGRANDGDRYATERLTELLAERGELDGLRAQADAGDAAAARLLAELLAERGDLNELHARAAAGEEASGAQLAALLVKQGRDEEAERLRRFGLNLDGSIACG